MNDNVSVGPQSVASAKSGMSQEEQDERRKQIREILKNSSLSQTEKSRTIQSLMDGRASRRSSVGSRSVNSRSVCSQEDAASCATSRTPADYVNTMAKVAAAAAEYYSSDDEGDAVMMDAPDDIYGYDEYDARSVASEITHSSHESTTDLPPALSYRQVHGRSYSLQDWNDETRAAAAVNTSFISNPAQISRLMEQSRPECGHYERNCTIISPCCGLAFGCRICHDECPVLPPPLRFQRTKDDSLFGDKMKKVSQPKAERRRSMPIGLEEEEENHHAIDRFAIREVLCRQCYTRQSSKTNNCIQCGIQFGAYHCNVCNLWMSDEDNPYHCQDCGFCRVGGRENFTHCHDCGMCIDAKLFNAHNCKAGKYMSNCPVCQEDLFSSRYASHEMPCGHAIHWHCFSELTSYDTRCPVCKKTAESPEQMAPTWSAIAMGIALQPVPPEMARMVNIVCNDCEERDSNRRWHFLGVRCMKCLSFNTAVEQTVLQGREAAEYLDQLEASRSGAGGVPANISVAALASSSDDHDDIMDEDIPSTHEISSGSTEATAS